MGAGCSAISGCGASGRRCSSGRRRRDAACCRWSAAAALPLLAGHSAARAKRQAPPSLGTTCEASSLLPTRNPLLPAPQDHRHTLTLLNHFTVAASHGNAHAVELLASALAVDMRLHNQACPQGGAAPGKAVTAARAEGWAAASLSLPTTPAGCLQAALDVLVPLLQECHGERGAELAARVQRLLQALDDDVLEVGRGSGQWWLWW